MKRWLTVFSVFVLCVVFSAGMAEANGTLTATFGYESSGGTFVPLSNAYVYLQVYGGPPIIEKYFRSAEYIYGPTNASGSISASVPEGSYKVRITRRVPLATTPTATGPTGIYGPPNSGDYTWLMGESGGISSFITVTTGSVINLGTVYATTFGSAGLMISGTVKGASGAVLSGWAVKATNEPCYSGNWNSGSAYSANQCGTLRYPAFTNASGQYSIPIPTTGTYYLYAAPHLGQFVNFNYPGGYPTCTASVGSEQSTSTTYFYYNCPINVSSSLTGQNIVVPGY